MISEDALVSVVRQIVIVVDRAEPDDLRWVVVRTVELVPHHEAAFLRYFAANVDIARSDAMLINLLHVVTDLCVALTCHLSMHLVHFVDEA